MPNIIDFRALGVRVLAVATLGRAEDWSVYIDAVLGENHENEAPAVAREGDKATQDLAEFLFPHFAEKYEYRR